ncbi:MAG: hypothetical protein IKQ71_11480 [Lachnospiraceae bacterium]|nr:hypothetical protein [Lachnospiraceae bacterium]
MLKRQTKKHLEELFTELKMNLENNYKDLARNALKKLNEEVETMKESGELKGKDYEKIRMRVDEYAKSMVGYHH